MSPEVQIALIVSIAPTLAALGSIWVTLKADRRSNEKLDEIHTLTNSNLTKATNRIASLEDSISKLVAEGSLTKKQGTKAKE